MHTVYPFHETEIQPLISSLWYNNISVPMMSMGNTFNPITPSVLRSMMVMDLMDCSFLNIDKSSTYKFYFAQLKKFYIQDPASQQSNIHNGLNLAELFDYTYFNTPGCELVMTQLYNQCYDKFLDIFADNGYEVLGPIYYKGYTFIIQYFRNLDKNVYKFVTYEQGKCPGSVDMFGHSTVQFSKNSKVVFEINGEIIYNPMDQYELTFDNDNRSNIEKYIDSRLLRVEKYIDRNLVYNELIHIIKNNELKPRITELNELLKLIFD